MNYEYNSHSFAAALVDKLAPQIGLHASQKRKS